MNAKWRFKDQTRYTKKGDIDSDIVEAIVVPTIQITATTECSINHTTMEKDTINPLEGLRGKGTTRKSCCLAKLHTELNKTPKLCTMIPSSLATLDA